MWQDLSTLFCLCVSYQYLTWQQTQSRYHPHWQDSSFIFLSAETCLKCMGRGMLRNTTYVLLWPQGPTPQAAGDQLVISPWKVPFLTAHIAKNLGSWLDFPSEILDNTESCSMQENSPIILFFPKENRFPAGDSLIQMPSEGTSLTQASRTRWLARVNKNSRQDVPDSWTSELSTHATRTREE